MGAFKGGWRVTTFQFPFQVGSIQVPVSSSLRENLQNKINYNEVLIIINAVNINRAPSSLKVMIWIFYELISRTQRNELWQLFFLCDSVLT